MTEGSLQRRLLDRIRVPDRLQSWSDRLFLRIRRAIQQRSDRFGGYQQELRRAAIPRLYDRYLARAIVDGLVAAGIGVVLWSLVGYLAISGQLARAGLPSLTIGPGGLAIVVSLGIGVIGGLVFFGVAVGYRIAVPRLEAARRRRAMNGLMPYMIVLLYSLSRGNMGFANMIDILADSRDTYGEIAVEFRRIREDLNNFGKDQLAALEAARDRSPSERFTDFLEDVGSIVDSGTDFQDFMAMQTSHQLDRMRRDNEDLLQTLNTFAETYFVIMFVAPLFGLVLLILLSFVGANTLPVIRLLIYVDLPLVTAGSIILAGRLGGARQSVARQDIKLTTSDDPDTVPDDEVVSEYVRTKQLRSIRRGIRHPLQQFRERPDLTLVVTVPIAVIVTGALIYRGILVPTTAFFATRPVLSTALVVGILVIPAIPLSLFHELKRIRERKLVEEFPSALEVIGEANEIGIEFVESCQLVARRLDGPIATELGRVYDDVQLTWNVDRAIAGMAGRIDIPEITLSLKVLNEGYRSSRDLSGVLESLSEAIEHRHDIERDRARAMRLYVFILVIGVLTFLAIAFFINEFFFPPLADVGGQLGAAGEQAQFLQPTAIPLEEYRMLLFHAGLFQAVGNGLLMGKLVDDRVLSGLKYAIGLTVVTVIVFLAL